MKKSQSVAATGYPPVDFPESWELRRNRFLFSERDERSVDGSETLFSLSKSRGLLPRRDLTDKLHRADSLQGYKVCRPGDIVMNKMQAWNGMFGLAEAEGIVSPDYTVFAPNSKIDPKFYSYLFSTPAYISVFHGFSRGIGTAFLRLNTSEFGAIASPVPPYSVQTAIADFLDRKTEAIDELIAKKEGLIDLLEEKRAALINRAVTKGLDDDVPMKASGFPWIGEIPKHWDVAPLRHISEVQTGLTKGRDLSGSETVQRPYLRVANVQDGYLDLSEMKRIELRKSEVQAYRVEEGDVLMNEGGDYDKLGRGTVWRGEIPGCVHQNHVFAVRPYDILHSDWLALYTQSAVAKHYFILAGKQTTNLASISASNLKDLPVLLPPEAEQREIADTLDARSDTNQSVQETVNRQIQLLREYRQSVVTGAVTGQINPGTLAESERFDSTEAIGGNLFERRN